MTFFQFTPSAEILKSYTPGIHILAPNDPPLEIHEVSKVVLIESDAKILLSAFGETMERLCSVRGKADAT